MPTAPRLRHTTRCPTPPCSISPLVSQRICKRGTASRVLPSLRVRRSKPPTVRFRHMPLTPTTLTYPPIAVRYSTCCSGEDRTGAVVPAPHGKESSRLGLIVRVLAHVPIVSTSRCCPSYMNHLSTRKCLTSPNHLARGATGTTTMPRRLAPSGDANRSPGSRSADPTVAKAEWMNTRFGVWSRRELPPCVNVPSLSAAAGEACTAPILRFSAACCRSAHISWSKGPHLHCITSNSCQVSRSRSSSTGRPLEVWSGRSSLASGV